MEKEIKAYIEFSTNVGCPNECIFCPQDVHVNNYKGELMLSLDNFMKMIDKLSIKCIISFSGFTEPFKNPYCTDMIEYATSKGHVINIYTTLKGMKIEHYEKIRNNANIQQMIIHLPDAENYGRIIVNNKLKELITYITKNPPHENCHWGFDIHGKNVHNDLKDIINVKKGYSYIHNRAGVLKSDDPNIRRVHWISGPIKCDNGFGEFEGSGVVMPNGDVYYCCMCFDLQEKHRLGNLLHQSWDEVMLSPVRSRMAEDRLTAKYQDLCRFCVDASKCRS